MLYNVGRLRLWLGIGCPTKERLNKTGLMSLSSRRIYSDLIFFYSNACIVITTSISLIICIFIILSIISTVPLKSKLPPLVSFLARRASFLARRFLFLARRVSFLSRITDAFSMAYITRKKPDMCNGCCSAVRWQIDGTVQHKMCIGFISA